MTVDLLVYMLMVEIVLFLVIYRLEGKKNILGTLVYSGVFTMLILGFTILSTSIIYTNTDFFEIEVIDHREEPIIALKDNTTSLTPFIGIKQERGNVEYFYMVNEDEGKKMNSVPVEVSHIKEHETITEPYIEIKELGVTSYLGRLFLGTNATTKEYVFNVPKGTITTDFTTR